MPDPQVVRVIATLHGRVQAVGFREHVLDLARQHLVAGSVANLHRSGDLEIDVEGHASEVDRFLSAVLGNPPAVARIDGVRRARGKPLGRTGFTRGATRP